MLTDTAFERRCTAASTLGLPRWYKRATYYIFKICYINYNAIKLSNIPGFAIREFLTRVYSNEYERYTYGMLAKN
jgi:hypothetical protein